MGNKTISEISCLAKWIRHLSIMLGPSKIPVFPEQLSYVTYKE